MLIEVILAHKTAGGTEIRWWGDRPIDLAEFATTQVQQLPVADPETLARFRRRHSLLPDGLWDHDFHPDEPDVRTFIVPPGGVLRRDDSVVVTVARYGEHLLWHYAFADRWFKINVTTDLDGRPAVVGDDGFTFNCDIATPMLREGVGVHAVDLFLDVLVGQNGRSYVIVDREEFSDALGAGLISPYEAAQAELGLQQLVAVVERGDLTAWLNAILPVTRTAAPAAMPMVRTAVSPVVAAKTRPTW